MQKAFKNLKSTEIDNLSVSLVIVSYYLRKREKHYQLKYVLVDEPLEKKLKKIVSDKISKAGSFEKYDYDSSEPEEDLVKVIDNQETDFEGILNTLKNSNQELNKIEGPEDLSKAKAYMIILRDGNGIKLIAFSKLPESWQMKKISGFVAMLYSENGFKDLDDDPVFRISRGVDFIYFQEYLFILNKKNFEQGLNFREGMLRKADKAYDAFENQKLFSDIDFLRNKVGDNLRWLRKIATIENLGHYKDSGYLKRIQTVANERGWNIEIKGGVIQIDEENFEGILKVLENKRLTSLLTDDDFDVESVKKVAAEVLS